ncbi:MAG TPA: hypothetical protein P5524_02835 [Candidatus Paceibacterota bacterium]|nr:hypothetical protein [Candidatus Paceibacterota bacterium]
MVEATKNLANQNSAIRNVRQARNNDEDGGNDNAGASSLNSRAGEKPPISMAEVIILLPIIVATDLLNLLTLTGFGYIVSLLASLTGTAIVTLWLIYKRRRLEMNLIASAVDMIPGLDVFPTRTIAFLIIVFKDRLPEKVKGKVDQATQVAEKIKGGGKRV